MARGGKDLIQRRPEAQRTIANGQRGVEVGVAIPIGCLVPLACAAAVLIGAGVLIGHCSNGATNADHVTVGVIDDGAAGGPKIVSTQVVPLR